MDTNEVKKAHFIGIKGVGMAMLAQYWRLKGVDVTGSDTAETFMTDPVLTAAKIKVKTGFRPENLPARGDVVVYSTAYTPERNPELAAALTRKIPVMTLPEALASVFNRHYGIAVTGSHGKTTTAACLAFLMQTAGLKPSAMVGAVVPQLGGLAAAGPSHYLVLEADEYQNKLRYFRPQAVILTNIDWDHPDFFPTPSDYQAAFIEFIKKIPARGKLVANYDDPAVRRFAAVNCRGRLVSYAIDEAADYVAYDLNSDAAGQYFRVKMAGGDDREESESDVDLGEFSIKLWGRHNVSNALAVVALAVEMDIPLFRIRQGLAEFAGTARRLEKIGEFRGALIFDDYAHHPTEVRATLAAARERWPEKRIIVVFHPHTYSRTKALLADFAAAFDEADEAVVLDIYGSAREQAGGVESRELVDLINVRKNKRRLGKAGYLPDLKAAEAYLRCHAGRGDVIVLMGAGDVFRIGNRLTEV